MGEENAALNKLKDEAQMAIESLQAIFKKDIKSIVPDGDFDSAVQVYELQIKCAKAVLAFVSDPETEEDN